MARIPAATRDSVPADQRAALAQFGVRGLTELTNLMGYYAALAFNVNAFGMETPDNPKEPALPV